MCSAMIRLASRTVDMSSCWSFIATSLPAARPSSFAPLKRRGAPGWIRDFADGRLQSLCGACLPREAREVACCCSLPFGFGPTTRHINSGRNCQFLRRVICAGTTSPATAYMPLPIIALLRQGNWKWSDGAAGHFCLPAAPRRSQDNHSLTRFSAGWLWKIRQGWVLGLALSAATARRER
jgi:hypothetical protein